MCQYRKHKNMHTKYTLCPGIGLYQCLGHPAPIFMAMAQNRWIANSLIYSRHAAYTDFFHSSSGAPPPHICCSCFLSPSQAQSLCVVWQSRPFTNRTKSVTHWNWLLLLGHWHRTPLWPTQRDVIHQPLIQLTTNSIYAYQRNQDMATWLAWDAPEGPQGNSDRRRRWW